MFDNLIGDFALSCSRCVWFFSLVVYLNLHPAGDTGPFALWSPGATLFGSEDVCPLALGALYGSESQFGCRDSNVDAELNSRDHYSSEWSSGWGWLGMCDVQNGGLLGSPRDSTAEVGHRPGANQTTYWRQRVKGHKKPG